MEFNTIIPPKDIETRERLQIQNTVKDIRNRETNGRCRKTSSWMRVDGTRFVSLGKD